MKTIKTVIALSAAFVGFSAHAQSTASTSAKLEMKGNVAQSCTIAVSALPKAAALNITAGEVNTEVGEVTEDCNSGTGYTVSVTSSHNGQLRSNPNDATAPLTTYSAIYDDASGKIDNGGLLATRNGAFFGRKGKLLVNVAANAQAIAGNYSDNVTFVIAAK